MKIKDIAKMANVSIATVSKIINNKDQGINKKTREKVLNLVKEYNYTPYGSTTKLYNSSNSFTFAIILKDNSKNYTMIDSIISLLSSYGYSTIIYTSENDLNKELKNIILASNNKVAGVLWEPVNSKSLEFKKHFEENSILYKLIEINFKELGWIVADKLNNLKHNKLQILASNTAEHQDIIDGINKYYLNNQIEKNFQVLSGDNFDTCITSNSCLLILDFENINNYIEKVKHLKYKIPENISICSIANENKNDVSSIIIPYSKLVKSLILQLISEYEKIENTTKNINLEYEFNHLKTLKDFSKQNQNKILVIGSINLDIILNVDNFPISGKTIKIYNSRNSIGGKGTNQAIGVAKLEYPVSLIGKIGNDEISNIIMKEFLNYPLDIQGIIRDDNMESGRAYIHLQKDGNSTISIFSGANDTLSCKDIENFSSIFDNTNFCLIQSEIPMSAIISALNICKQKNIKVIFKPSTLTTIEDNLLKMIDIFIPNREEAYILSNKIKSVPKMADFFYEKGCPIVIITLGKDGCYVKTKDFEDFIPTIKVTTIDNTGASDAFISTLSVYLSLGYPLLQAVKFANYSASFSVTKQGVINSMIDKISLENFINKI